MPTAIGQQRTVVEEKKTFEPSFVPDTPALVPASLAQILRLLSFL